MHVENELVEIVTIDDREFEEIIKEYEEEVLMREKVLEPPLTDLVDTTPAQGKPRYITPYFFYNHSIYMFCAFTLQESYENHMHRYICHMSLTSAGSSSCYA